MGMFSNQLSSVEQLGQWEAGKTMEAPVLGSLSMTTLRKEPITVPRIKLKVEKSVFTGIVSVIVCSNDGLWG